MCPFFKLPFDTPEGMKAKIDEYFEIGGKELEVEAGKGPNKYIATIKVHTLTGMIHYLGFPFKARFYDMSKKGEEWDEVVKYGSSRAEQVYEEKLHTAFSTGAIFSLKNMGWSDRQEITGPEGGAIAIEIFEKSISKVYGKDQKESNGAQKKSD